MPRRLEHTYSGALAALGHAALSTRDLPASRAFAEAIGQAIGGGLGGQLPDRIEPATHPNHRGFAHSVSLGLGIVALLTLYVPQAQFVLRQAGEAVRQRRKDFEPDSWQWIGCSVLEILIHVLAGVAAGLPVGYLSHLGLDQLKSSKGIPLIA